MPIGTRLIGRDSEMERLGEAVGQARDGARATVVIEGEPGIGKSRIVQDLLISTRDSKDHVAIGHGIELVGGELPYGAISESLRTLIRDAGTDAVRAAAGAYVDQLAALCPLLGPAPNSDVERLQILPGYVSMLEKLADDHLIWLVIEDLHWVDASSRDLLSYLIRIARPCQLLVLLTVRTHDPTVSNVVTDLVHGLTSLGTVDRITLRPLSVDDSAALVADLTAGSATDLQVARVIALAEGSPLLTEQLVAAGLDPTAETVAGPMARRIRALDPATRRLLQLASLGEQHLSHRLLANAYADDGFDHAVTTALEEGLLTHDPSDATYHFRHALLRQAAEDSMKPHERIAGHRRWAELLTEASDRTGGPQTAIAAAHHWAAAEVDDMAFDSALGASQIATRFAAPAEAATLLTRVLSLWDRVPDPQDRAGQSRDDILYDAVWALVASANETDALALIEAELARNEDDPFRTLCLRLAHSGYRPLGADEAGSGLYSDALRQFDALMAAPPTSLPLLGLLELGWFVRFTDPDLSYRLHERALEVAHIIGDRRQLRHARIDMVQQLVHRGRTDEALTVCIETRAGAHSILDQYGDEVDRGYVLGEAGRFNEAIAALEHALARLSDPHLTPYWWAWGSGLLTDALLAVGEWDRAQALIEDAARLRYDCDDKPLSNDVTAGLLACLRGDLDAAEQAATRARTNFRRGIGDAASPLFGVGLLHLECEIAAANGDSAAVTRMVTPVLNAPGIETYADAWPVLLTAARVEGDLAEQADSSIEDPSPSHESLRAAADKLPRTNGYNHARYLQAVADLNRAEGIDGVADWVSVVDAWRLIGHVHHLGWASLRLATALVRTADRADAAAPLAEAWDIAQDLHAVALKDAVVGLARRARITLPSPLAHPRSATAGPLGRLTQRELEVLHHVALGLSNDEIATALFISPKTASVHVSRILAKLGVGSRTKATALAYEHGLINKPGTESGENH